MQNRPYRPSWFSRKGRPLTDMKVVDKLLSNKKYQRVARYENGRYLVSTVWLGLNHGYNSNKKLIFETMVFKKPLLHPKRLGKELLQQRYSTEEKALRGHKLCADIYKIENDFRTSNSWGIALILAYLLMLVTRIFAYENQVLNAFTFSIWAFVMIKLGIFLIKGSKKVKEELK